MTLPTIAGLHQFPYLFCLWLAQTVIDHVATHQHDAFMKKQLGEEGEDYIGLCIRASALVILEERSQLHRI